MDRFHRFENFGPWTTPVPLVRIGQGTSETIIPAHKPAPAPQERTPLWFGICIGLTLAIVLVTLGVIMGVHAR